MLKIFEMLVYCSALMYWTVNLQGVTGFNGSASLTLDLHLTPSVLFTTRNALPTFPLLPKSVNYAVCINASK